MPRSIAPNSFLMRSLGRSPRRPSRPSATARRSADRRHRCRAAAPHRHRRRRGRRPGPGDQARRPARPARQGAHHARGLRADPHLEAAAPRDRRGHAARGRRRPRLPGARGPPPFHVRARPHDRTRPPRPRDPARAGPRRSGVEIVPAQRIGYDTLVIAVGSVLNDFGVPGVAEHCLYLDSLAHAERIQQLVLAQVPARPQRGAHRGVAPAAGRDRRRRRHRRRVCRRASSRRPPARGTGCAASTRPGASRCG